MSTVTINGKEVDLSGAMPLTVGDLRKFKKSGVDMNEFTAAQNEGRIPDPDMMANMIFVMCKKAGANVTADDIDEISINDLENIVSAIFDTEDDLDRPT